MREIKFRAWDKELKEYVDINNTAIDPTNGDVVELGGYELLDVNRFAVLEQYTGLKDKNGIDIYENDIVKPVEEDVDFEDAYYQIVYNETGEYPAFDLKGWNGTVNGISELSLTYGIEVVGNIHENADLLEVH